MILELRRLGFRLLERINRVVRPVPHPRMLGIRWDLPAEYERGLFQPVRIDYVDCLLAHIELNNADGILVTLMVKPS